MDFPAERDGERVLLCWRLGEDDVGLLPHRRAGLQRAAAACDRRRPWPRAGATPPTARRRASRRPRSPELRYAPDAATLATAHHRRRGAVLLAGRTGWIENAFDRPRRFGGSSRPATASTGSCSPRLVASEVVVTNARGVFDEPIAEWAIGAMCAFATGLQTTIVDQTRRAAGRTTGIGNGSPGKHLVVVGPGPIGRATASRALALGMTVSRSDAAPATTRSSAR